MMYRHCVLPHDEFLLVHGGRHGPWVWEPVFVAAYMLDVGESVFGGHGVPAPDGPVGGLRPPENPAQNEPLAATVKQAE
jgi:hypothetical protein